jgi:hypothetical protein
MMSLRGQPTASVALPRHSKLLVGEGIDLYLWCRRRVDFFDLVLTELRRV